MTWEDPGWKDAAAEYHKARGSDTLIVRIEPERLARLRKALSDSTCLTAGSSSEVPW